MNARKGEGIKVAGGGSIRSGWLDVGQDTVDRGVPYVWLRTRAEGAEAKNRQQ